MEPELNFSEQIGFRCSPDLRESLEKLAKDDGRPLGQYVRLTLERHVKAVAATDAADDKAA